MYYFDIGSSTIKLYEYKNELTLIEEKSIMFKKGFSEEGIQEENKEKMMAFIKEVKEKYNLDKNNTEIYATGIWRKIPNEQLANIEARFNELDLEFNVISHDKENYYFEKAMQGTYNNRVMMVNMGGKTTELVIFDNDTVENRVNLTVGVSDVFDKYPNINELDSGISKEEVINYLENLISEDINFNCDIAIHTGGELRFQKLVKYNLQPNKFFDDGIHKVYVTYEDFDKKNEELLNKTTLDAVSYTHLDVYKRQGIKNFRHLRTEILGYSCFLSISGIWGRSFFPLVYILQ